MFKVINPKDQPYYRGRIDLLMGMMHYFQEVSLTLEEQKISTFIIAEVDPQNTSSPNISSFKENSLKGDHFKEEFFNENFPSIRTLPKLLDKESLLEDDLDSKNDSLLEGEIYGGALLYQRNVTDLPLKFQHFVDVSSQETPTESPLIWGSTTSFFMNPSQRHPFNRNELDGCQKFYQDLLEKFMEFGQSTKTDFLYLTLCPFEYERTKNKGFWPYVLEIKPEESPDGLFYGILPLSAQQKKRRHRRVQSKNYLFPQPPLQWAA